MTQYIGAVPEAAKQEVIRVDQSRYDVKNIVYNGLGQINQRGFTSATATNYYYGYALDGYLFYHQRAGGTQTLSRETSDVPSLADTDGVQIDASVKILCSTATTAPTGADEAEFLWRVEGYDWQKLYAQYSTLSFWVKSNQTGQKSVSIGDGSRSFTTLYSIKASGTWQRVSIVLPPDASTNQVNDNAKRLQVAWNLRPTGGTVPRCPTSALNSWQATAYVSHADDEDLYDTNGQYLSIAGVQWEKGQVATQLENTRYSDAFTRCQRYYQRLNSDDYSYQYWGAGFAFSSADVRFLVHLETKLRDKPTVTFNGSIRSLGVGGTIALTNSLLDASTQGGKDVISVRTLQSGHTQGNTYFLTANNSTSAYIDIDAEL